MKAWPLALGVGTGVALAHVAPAATWLKQPTTLLLPALKGVGRADHVALTFDDGPDATSTPRFLDELDRLGWKATFFLLGDMVRRSPDVAAEIVARGHEVGLHGDRHRSHLARGPVAVYRDLASGLDAVAEATGTRPRWFRPPYGELSAGTLFAVRRLGLHPVLWTTWGKDWRPGETGHSVADRVLAGLVPGATVLLHDSDCTSTPGSWRATLAALPRLAEGFDPQVTVGPLRDHFARASVTPIRTGAAHADLIPAPAAVSPAG